jgi:putative flippase GtrA
MPRIKIADIGPTVFRRFGAFLVVGLASCAAYFAVLSISIEIARLGTLVSAFAAFLAGSVVSYVGNTLLTFTAEMTSRTAIRFGAVVLLGLGANQAIAYGLDRIGVHYLLIGLVIYAVVPLLNFAAHHFFTYDRTAA